MNAELLSDITHLASRLQSAGMSHAQNVREFLPGDSVAVLLREAEQLQQLADRLAFKVGQLQTSIAAEVRRPRLDEFVTLRPVRDDSVYLHPVGMLSTHKE